MVRKSRQIDLRENVDGLEPLFAFLHKDARRSPKMWNAFVDAICTIGIICMDGFYSQRRSFSRFFFQSMVQLIMVSNLFGYAVVHLAFTQQHVYAGPGNEASDWFAQI